MPGYRKDFLEGVDLPLPTFSAELSEEIHDGGKVYNYPTYSIIMNSARDKRSPAIVCLNINQSKLRKTKRSKRWKIDQRIGSKNQLNNDYYVSNPWDRGHMARRTTAAQGDTVRDAQHASDETFYYSNSCLQHANLNQDEWLGLEDWVYGLKLDNDGRITSFSGPFYGDNDRTIRPSGRRLALIPAGFFKVVCFINKDTNKLDVRAFVMYQDVEALRDKRGRKRYNNQHYQVTITEVEQLTGLRFDDSIYQANPLYYSDNSTNSDENITNFPEVIEVSKPEDIVAAGEVRQTINDDIVDVFISAAMVDPAGNDSGNEWVSLINLGRVSVDITDWELSDNSDQRLNLNTALSSPEHRVLLPGQSVVIKGLSPLRLSNSKDVIKLFDADGARIDWVNYNQGMVKSGMPLVFLSPRDTLEI